MKTILFLLLIPCFVFAQPQQSENFRITKSAIDAGGAISSSEDFRLTSAFGQSSPLGRQGSSDFNLSSGFLSPLLSVSPLSPIQDLVIKYSAPDAKLYWHSIIGAHSYSVYRSADPLFELSPATFIGSANDTSYTDPNILALPSLRNYYIVTASSSGGVLLTVRGPKQYPSVPPAKKRIIEDKNNSVGKSSSVNR